MPFTARSGIRIHYEVMGIGPPMLLLHGQLGSGRAWRLAGYVDDLETDWQLVTIDARGHGRSDKPTDPKAYRVSSMVADVIAVLDDLTIRSAVAFGWSMGGDTALALAALAPERVQAVVAIGAFGRGVGFADTPRVPEVEVIETAVSFETHGTTLVADELERHGRAQWADLIREADAAAVAARVRMLLDLLPLPYRVQELRPPLLAIWGANEDPSRPTLPAHAQTFVVPGEDHFGAFLRSDLVIPRVRDFLAASGAPSSTR
jgi:pimeloyl-ACP methyl ester carboxylesterase